MPKKRLHQGGTIKNGHRTPDSRTLSTTKRAKLKEKIASLAHKFKYFSLERTETKHFTQQLQGFNCKMLHNYAAISRKQIISSVYRVLLKQ